MNNFNQITTRRIEAFSDGVIAIIITVMVFDLKLEEIANDKYVINELLKLVPKFITYAVSFLMLSVMWVNHHQLFHQIKHSDRKLLWYSINLLFWMSLVPFATNFTGSNPQIWQSSFFYGMIFFMCAVSFTILRNYVIKSNLLHENINKQAHIKIRNKNSIALIIYLSGSLLSIISVYISFILFLIVPAMYFIPEKINHLNNTEQ